MKILDTERFHEFSKLRSEKDGIENKNVISDEPKRIDEN